MNRRFYCDERTEVMTAAGKVRGCFLNDLYYFRGIPYAEAERYAEKSFNKWLIDEMRILDNNKIF